MSGFLFEELNKKCFDFYNDNLFDLTTYILLQINYLQFGTFSQLRISLIKFNKLKKKDLNRILPTV